MISTGIALANAAIRSISAPRPRASITSSSVSTRSTRRASIAAMWRGVSAPAIRRRTRVCSGGSLKTRLVVWCSNSGEAPYFGANSSCLSELKVAAVLVDGDDVGVAAEEDAAVGACA